MNRGRRWGRDQMGCSNSATGGNWHTRAQSAPLLTSQPIGLRLGVRHPSHSRVRAESSMAQPTNGRHRLLVLQLIYAPKWHAKCLGGAREIGELLLNTFCEPPTAQARGNEVADRCPHKNKRTSSDKRTKTPQILHSFPSPASSAWGTHFLEALLPVLRSRASGVQRPSPISSAACAPVIECAGLV